MTPLLADLTLAEAGRAVRRGEVTSRRLTEMLLQRIADLNPGLGCFIRVDAERALAAACRADAEIAAGHWRGPLHGVPLAHKDIFDRPGFVTTAGSRIPDRPAKATATVIARLDAAGAIDFGSLNMDEFAAGGTGDNLGFGRCRNPWNPLFITGGSSSGSAAAVAARLVFGSFGADAGGSIRQPAACCGVVGLKPTYGRVSRAAAAARSWSVDCIGPFARTAEDCALLLQVVAGEDAADPTAGRVPVPDYASMLGEGVRGRRIGLAVGPWFEDVSDEIARLLQDAAVVFRDLGAATVSIEIPDLALVTDLQQVLVKCEAATLHAKTLRTRPADVSWRVRSLLYEGFFIPAPRYLEALSLRAALLERHVREVFGNVDLLLAPVNSEAVPEFQTIKTESDAEQETLFSRSARFTRFANYLGTPGLVVPCGFTGNRLPSGFQLLGRPYAEAELLAAGHTFLQATGWQRHKPPCAVDD